MIFQTQTTVRAVDDQDRTQLANMIHFGTYVHRHLDWRPPLEWIGHDPFFTLESDGRLISALACGLKQWVRPAAGAVAPDGFLSSSGVHSLPDPG